MDKATRTGENNNCKNCPYKIKKKKKKRKDNIKLWLIYYY